MKIVVGIDGSDESRAAFAFAVREAKTHGAKLQAVTTWNVAPMVYGGPVAPPLPEIGEGMQEGAKIALREAVESLGADAEGIEVEQVVREGHAGQTLVELAREADMLVVGTHGRGKVTGLLLGSVSQYCAQHTPCPIVIVPLPH